MDFLSSEDAFKLQHISSDVWAKLYNAVPSLRGHDGSIWAFETLPGTSIGGTSQFEDQMYFIEYKINGTKGQYNNVSIFDFNHPGVIIGCHLDGRLFLNKNNSFIEASMDDCIEACRKFSSSKEYDEYIRFKNFI